MLFWGKVSVEVSQLSEWTLKKALEFALNKEEDSIKLYTSAQEKVVSPSSKEFLKELVKEEEKHKNRILEVIEDPNKIEDIGHFDTKIMDLKIVDYLVDVKLSSDADYQQILIYAGKKEKAAHDFYLELATRFKDEQIGKLFARLAREELSHKYRLEKEYDDVVLKFM